MLNKYAEFYRGLRAYESHEKCPEYASEPFQKGFGMGYSSGFMIGDAEREIDEWARRAYADDFNKLLKEAG